MRTTRRSLPGLAALTCISALLAALPLHAAVEPLAIGSLAPPFRLQDQTGQWTTLQQFKGKWVVLYFYPKDNTPGCTTEACEFRDNIFAFRREDVAVYGVSVDDVDSHKSFAEDQHLPFPILADPSKKTAAAYGVLYKAMGIMEIARRETFVIDPDGKIAKGFATCNFHDAHRLVQHAVGGGGLFAEIGRAHV